MKNNLLSKCTTLCDTPSNKKNTTRFNGILALFLVVMGMSVSWGQTNPTVQSLPYTQNFGTTTFTTMPAGMAAWTGGGNRTTQTAAEGGTPGADATITAATTSQTGGNIYGYAVASNARAYIQQSSNSTNGTNTIAVAINTGVGVTNINISYQLELINVGVTTQDFGLELQYRAGTTGSWTNITGSALTFGNVASYTTSTLNYNITGLTASTDYQIRWITWRPSGTGASKGIGIDNISITAVANAPTVTSSAASSLATTSATLNGNVTSAGGATVTERGFVYKTTAGATISDNKTTVTGTTGAYTLTPTLLVNTQYFFKAYAINSVNTTLSTPELSFYTLANVPGTPTVSNPTTTSLDVTINANSNPSSTEYAIETGGNYVQSNGTLSASAVWQTAAVWGTKTVTSLSPSTTYTFKVKARNGANTETAFGTTGNGTTSASSTPTISGGATSAAFTTTYGTESGVQTFAISGTNLTTDITATAPTGFLVSSDGSNYGATATFSQVGGAVTGSLRIKLAATANVTGSYNSQNIVLSATGATNVNISTTASGNSVTAAVLTVIGLSTTDKIYNRTTSVVINGTAAFSNLQNGESFTPNDVVTWAFADALVGINKTLTRIGTYAAPSTNYTVTQPSLTATISALTLTTSGTASVISKTYDRNTTATITGISLVGVISPDVVIISGTYNDKTVNVGKAVTLSLSGADNANYSWTAPTASGDITSAALTITNPAVTSKPFDGNTSATITGTLSGVLVGDTVTFNGTGIFASSAIANGISVTSTATLSGADAGNYTLTQPSGLTGNITALIIAGWNFFNQNSPTTFAANTYNNNLVSASLASDITRGTGAASSTGGNSFRTVGFQNNGISTSNTDYFQIKLTAASGYLTSLSSIDAKVVGTGTYCVSPGVSQQFAYSLDGTNFNLISSPQITIGTPGTLSQIDLSGISALQNVAAGTTITIRYYASGQTTTGGWGFNSPSAATSDNGLSIAGSVLAIPTNDWTGGTGNWNTAANWSLSRLPLTTDNITISSGSPVMDVDYTSSSGRTLTISGTGGLTINSGKTLSIAGTADFGGKAVIIKSDSNGTGAIGQVTGTLTGASKVTVERYIPAKRAWRALTAPVVGTTNTSVFYNWQNNGSTIPNTGVEIWSNTSADPSVTNAGLSSSLLSYDSNNVRWTAITNTASTPLFSNTVNNPFMVFVTGPYASTSTNIANLNTFATTLKATGTLLTGDQTYTTIASKYTFIGNPYASPIDLSVMMGDTQNATASFGGNVWVWDANASGLNAVGTYNLYSSGTYTNLTSNNVVTAGTQIQSGQAFFVKSTNGATFTIKESHKGSTFSNAVFRTGALPELLRVGLYKQVNNDWSGRDGAMTVILADADANQASNKMANGTENIAFTKNGASFASNHQLPLVASDVLNVKVWNTTAGANYKLKINTEEFSATNLEATLEDLFTNVRTPLTLDGTSVEYPFTVTADAMSTGNRFRIVFQTSALGTTIPKANGFSIVPNPVTGDSFQVNLGSLATGTYSYSICNAIGQEVEKGSIDTTSQNTNYTIKMNNSATGIYIMKIKGSDNSVFTAKIIKK